MYSKEGRIKLDGSTANIGTWIKAPLLILSIKVSIITLFFILTESAQRKIGMNDNNKMVYND